MINSYLS